MTTENAPAGQGEGADQNTYEGEPIVTTVLAEPPHGYEEWPDISEAGIPDGGLITPDAVAWAIAQWEQRQSGRQLMHRVENKPYGPRIHTHPDLIRAVRQWYADIGAGIAQYTPTSTGSPVAQAASTDATAAEDPTPCSMFTWCYGHDRHFPERDAVHMARILIATYGGEERHVHASFYLPAADFDEPAHWLFSMPEESDWEFGVNEIDRELDAGVAELESARAAIRAFLAEVGESADAAAKTGARS